MESEKPLTASPGGGEMLRWLRRREAYPERPRRVECIETHISWVFLTDRCAYKLKKPVRFEFLDFSTAELRRAACEDEVRLNRRLAPDVYLGVVPIIRKNGRFALEGVGGAVDWLVKMRRLPADRALDRLIQSGECTDFDVRQIGATLADFYQQLPPLTLRRDEYRREIERHIQGNREELLKPTHGLPSDVVKRVHGAQLQLIHLQGELLDNRVLDGRIVEGHGDLRPEHIYLLSTPVIIDCIEFNEEFRQLDVADELSFLAMECAQLDASSWGDRLIEIYSAATGDSPDPRLLAFYKSYRACVRAKVLALRSDQLDRQRQRQELDKAGAYLSAADAYADAWGRPLLLVVRGLSGTGKSTLAEKVGELLGAEVLSTDAIRRDMFGASQTPAGYNQGIYSPPNQQRVYEELFQRGGDRLRQGLSVVLDGTFMMAETRARAADLAQRCGAAALVVRCHCPDALARERIEGRTRRGESDSEARPDIFDAQRRQEQPDPPGLPACSVDTTEVLSALVDEVTSQLSHRLAATPGNPRAGDHHSP